MAAATHAYHLLRCLIQMALADGVLADAETEVLDQLVRTIGQLDAEIWEQTWAEAQAGVEPLEVFQAVPNDDRLRRFILREIVVLARADGDVHPNEELLMALAADSFGLSHELDRFASWAARADAIFQEGEALLDAV